jgi:hypothetical protein
MLLDSRNSLLGFAERVRRNLVFINFARNVEADVHVVTALMTSLQGLIVFPVEAIKAAGYKGFQLRTMESLVSAGWPNWEFELGSSPTLHDLLFHLRNAISHRRVWFSSDSRKLEEVRITFSDQKPKENAVYWVATINGADLKEFVLRLAELLHHIEQYEN